MHHTLNPRRFLLPRKVEEGYRRWFARELVRRGHEVCVVAPEYAGDAHIEDFELVRLPARTIFFDPEDRLIKGAAMRGAMRSLATRDYGSEISQALPDVLAACKVAGFDLIVVETSGIGQGDAAIVPHVDVPMYVMTPEFGAASQLEKIDMLDFAEFVAINKFDRKGAADALRDVAKQVQRNKEAFGRRPEEMPVFGTMAARFNDDGVTALFQALKLRLAEIGLRLHEGKLPLVNVRHSSNQTPVVPPARTRYLSEISDTVRAYKQRARRQAVIARELQQLRSSQRMLTSEVEDAAGPAADLLETLAAAREGRLDGCDEAPPAVDAGTPQG